MKKNTTSWAISITEISWFKKNLQNFYPQFYQHFASYWITKTTVDQFPIGVNNDWELVMAIVDNRWISIWQAVIKDIVETKWILVVSTTWYLGNPIVKKWWVLTICDNIVDMFLAWQAWKENPVYITNKHSPHGTIRDYKEIEFIWDANEIVLELWDTFTYEYQIADLSKFILEWWKLADVKREQVINTQNKEDIMESNPFCIQWEYYMYLDFNGLILCPDWKKIKTYKTEIPSLRNFKVNWKAYQIYTTSIRVNTELVKITAQECYYKLYDYLTKTLFFVPDTYRVMITLYLMYCYIWHPYQHSNTCHIVTHSYRLRKYLYFILWSLTPVRPSFYTKWTATTISIYSWAWFAIQNNPMFCIEDWEWTTKDRWITIFLHEFTWMKIKEHTLARHAELTEIRNLLLSFTHCFKLEPEHHYEGRSMIADVVWPLVQMWGIIWLDKDFMKPIVTSIIRSRWMLKRVSPEQMVSSWISDEEEKELDKEELKEMKKIIKTNI